MAAITLTYVYPDGAGFNAGSHNANVYSATGGRGVFSESNGYLDTNNLAAGFELQPYHVMPEEAVFARFDGALDSTDFFSIDSGSDVESDTFYVGGAGLRVYVPYDVTAIQWNVMFHVQPLVYVKDTFNDQNEVTSKDETLGSIQYMLRLNGSELTHTRRLLPSEVRLADTSLTEKIRRGSYGVNLQHLQEGVSAGWHDINLACYISTISENGEYYLLSQGTDSRLHGNFDLYQRVTFGIRSATALVLL